MGAFDALLNFLAGLFAGSNDPAKTPAEGDSAQDNTIDMGIGGGPNDKISHALVLPDQNFLAWYRAAEPYTRKFERVAVVRSPSGNDLNRFRNVTAVQTANVWLNNNALQHIRRIYPNVVRVDTLKVATPDQLKQALQRRIDRNDRYGATQNSDGHLDDRFVLGWPSDALPASIVTPFDALIGGKNHEGIDIFAPIGTTIRATLSGTVAVVVREPTALGYGQYVQIGVQHGDTSYLVIHGHLRDITVRTGQQVNAGDPIGVSDWESIKLVVQAPGKGLSGYPLPHVIDPTRLIYWNTMRLRPTDNGLRVRKRPSTDFEIVGKVNLEDDLETLEPHGRTLAKVGREDEWINVRMPNGTSGYSAAWFLNAVDPALVDRTRLTGINLDYAHRLGRPSPNRLGNLGWVRFAYNVSYNPENNSYGNTDLGKAHARYRPFIEQYARAGYQVMLVFTHQTYGEGAGFNWNQMDSGRWAALSNRLIEMIREIARQYAGSNLIHAYQIWNEQDAHQGAPASVPVPPGNYAFMLGESIRAIRASDKHVRIITGGHTGGPGNGVSYARATLKAMPPGIQPDGIAFHPYGRGTQPGPPYAIFGHIDESMQRYGTLQPGKPLWITEWGVLDHPTDPAGNVSAYASDMVRYLRLKYPGRVAAMIWFAWAQSMHNGYGLVGEDDRPRQPLYDDFLRL